MRVVTLARILAYTTLTIGLTGCPKTTVTISSYPGTFGQPGYFADFAVSVYENPSLNFGISSPPNPSTAANVFSNAMRNAQWSESTFGRSEYGSHEFDVTAQSIMNSFSAADAVWFSGHGADGDLELAGAEDAYFSNNPNVACWGVGNNGGPGTETYCRDAQRVTGKTKWLFAYSSSSASAPRNFWPQNPESTADWTPIFGGSLHGLYGFWQGPGRCDKPFDPTHACDIKKEDGENFARALVDRMINDHPNHTVHEAWVFASHDLGKSGNWAIWEDQFSKSDHISTDNGGNGNPSGWIYYYNAARPNGYPVGHVNVGTDRFTLRPISVNPEYVNDNSLLSSAQPYFGAPDSYRNDGTKTIAIKDSASAQHILATGATSYYGVLQYNAVTFDQTTAYNTAVAAIQNGQGLPGDAQLSDTLFIYQASPLDGSQIQIGYEFIWKHSGSPFGNDAMRVIVDDYQYEYNTTCAQWDYTTPDPPQKPVRYCAVWNTAYSDNPNVSYMYRLWRSPGSVRRVSSLGQTSLDANTASHSLPSGDNIVGYQQGLWTGAGNDPNGNDGTPAWVFQLAGGGEAYVDAYTGQYLGTIVD